jgi:hypothetical protein
MQVQTQIPCGNDKQSAGVHLVSGADEGDVGDFGGAVEAEGHAYRAEAAVDVELHVVDLEEAFDVLLAHGGKDEGADDGEADLAAVGVAGEHEVDGGEAGMAADVVGVVGLVAEQDGGGAVGEVGDGEVEVGVAGSGVVGSAEPEDVAAALDGGVAVDEDGQAVGFEGRDDVGWAGDGVVVAEDAEALGNLEAGEDLCADAGGLPGEGEGQGAVADEVAGDDDELGVEGVDLVDDLFEEPGLGELFEVDVGDLDEAEVLEGVGQIGDGEGAVDDLELVSTVCTGVGSEADGRCGGAGQEGAPGEGVGAVFGRGVTAGSETRGHRP